MHFIYTDIEPDSLTLTGERGSSPSGPGRSDGPSFRSALSTGAFSVDGAMTSGG
jgi:hypothetical protein